MDQRIADLIDFNFQEKSNTQIVATFLVNKNLPSFEGHFPDNAILPAVSIIDISLYLLSFQLEGISHSKIEMKRSKFMSMVRPGQNVELLAESEDEGTSWKITWRLKADQSKLAKVHLVV